MVTECINSGMRMGKISCVTFTGVDERTDVERLKHIQGRYPATEFGILISRNWKENGNRYLNPELMPQLKGLHLSAHLCGHVAKEALKNNFQPAMEMLGDDIIMFDRIQINAAPYSAEECGEILSLTLPNGVHEIIIQQKPGRCGLFLDYYNKFHPDNVTMLFDSSCGTGTDSAVITMTGVGKMGYAGGISPENVLIKARDLADIVQGECWIDMETGIRTDDWLDLDKVEKVLDILSQDGIISKA